MFDIEPSIVYPMIDRLLGGGHENQPPPSRPLSEIELPLAARITRLFLQQLCLAWKNALDLDLKLEVLQVESNPRLLRVLPADEMVVLVGFQLRIGDLRGMMRLCLPCRAMRRSPTAFAKARRRQWGSIGGSGRDAGDHADNDRPIWPASASATSSRRRPPSSPVVV